MFQLGMVQQRIPVTYYIEDTEAIFGFRCPKKNVKNSRRGAGNDVARPCIAKDNKF